MKRHIALFVALVMAPAMIQAQILYDGAGNNVTTDFDAFNTNQDFGSAYGAGTYGIEAVASGDADDHFGSNNMHMWDLNTGDKPELQGELAGQALLGAWSMTFSSYNNSSNTSSKAIRWRMANYGDSVTSESRSAFSLSWQADGKITAKYSDGGANDGDANDVDTTSFSGGTGDPFDNLFKVIDVMLVGNNADVETYSYMNVLGDARHLYAQHYDVYINDGSGWDLLNSGTDAWKVNGLKYTLEKSAANYNPAEGLGRFGLLGSSNSDVDPQVYFDDIAITVIPEPATLGLLGISGAFLLVTRRMRRK